MRPFARIVSGLCCSALMLGAATAAHADSYGPLTFTVWIGTFNGGVSDIADNAHTPGIASTATFTYTGPINFVNNNGDNSQNTFLNFFGAANEANISGISSSALNALNSDILSTPGETGTATNAYFEITGTMFGNGTLGLSSDDGSCFYLGGSAVSGLCNPNPQTNTPASGTVNAGSGTTFRLDYVESNGSPADLTLTGASYATPEPGSIFMVGTGLVGLAGLVRRRLVA